MKSPVKPRLMQVLIDGEPHREIELAQRAGFTKIATIRRWIDAFLNAGFIERYQEPEGTDYLCRLMTKREIVLKIYNHPEFRLLRPAIRQAPWFCPLFTAQFADLPKGLPALVDDMVRSSHTFFDTICIYESPEEIRKTYRPALIVNRLAGIGDPAFDDLCIFYHIYINSVIRDIHYGGLSEGFARLLEAVEGMVEERYAALARPARTG